jgi:16S rRNA (cytidine1402-2'-O)-methyltransferase
MLSVVATPIGNLGDISFRALEVLNSADYILSEDTRVFKKLAMRYEIKTKVFSFHSHSGEHKINEIIKDLKDGKQIALVSDAGTPLISDPGFSLVSACRKNHIQVSPIPGSTSIIAALSACGFPADKFLYLGFFPAKKGRQTLAKKMAESEYTCVFLESVHRIAKTLNLISEHFDDERLICVAREITKIHEEFRIFQVKDLENELKSLTLKGEFVIMVAPSGFNFI